MEVLSDDAFLVVLEVLLDLKQSLDLKQNDGALLRREAARSRADVAAVFCLARRFTALLRSPAAAELLREAKARASATVYPVSLQGSAPYTRQIALEHQSKQQLRALNKAVRAMSLHCAGACCRRYRRCLLKDSGVAATPIFETCSMLAAHDGGFVAHVRKRGGDARFTDRLVRVQDGVETHVDIEDAPLVLACYKDAAAFVTDASHPKACMWHANGITRVSCGNNPQALCFHDCNLLVAVSASYFHTTGHGVVRSVGGYGFETFDASVELLEKTSTYTGRELVEATSARAGSMLCIAKVDGLRSLFLHDVGTDMETSVSPGCPASLHGPLCAAVSPSGEFIATAHRTPHDMQVMTLQKQAATYVPYSSTSIAFAMCLDVPTEGAPFDAFLVRSWLALCFSPCGRFVCARDRKPEFGIASSGCGVAVVDLAAPRTVRPLFGGVDQSPRDFLWYQRGVAVLPPGTSTGGAITCSGGCVMVAPVGEKP